jgi:hypothetical protein
MTRGRKLSVENLLAQATCAVLIDGKVAGTAWLFGQEGYLLTAGHVLGRQKPLARVEVRFSEDVPRLAYKVQHIYAHESGIDFAVLKLAETLTDRSLLPIVLTESVKGEFVVLGYGKSLVDRSSGVGTFTGFFDPQDSSANRLFKLESTQLGEQGYSGCAIFSKEVGAVIAIQTEATRAKTGAERDTVLAMPLYRIAQLWPPLIGYAQNKVDHSKSDPPRKVMQPDKYQKRELVNALLACTAMSNPDTRDAIVSNLPDSIKNTIQRSNINRVYVNNIVARCLSFVGGIEELVDLVREFEESESIEMRNVDTVIRRIKGI